MKEGIWPCANESGGLPSDAAFAMSANLDNARKLGQVRNSITLHLLGWRRSDALAQISGLHNDLVGQCDLMFYTLRDVAHIERFKVLKGSGRQLLEFQ